MKAWMTDDAKREFPTLDQVLTRLLTDADNSLKQLPELKLGPHRKCFDAVCQSLRQGLDDEKMPHFMPAKIMEYAHDHVGISQRAEQNWETVIMLVTWKMLEFASIAMHGAVGHGLMIISNDGRVIETHKNEALLHGLTGVLSHVHVLRHLVQNPDLTWKQPLKEINSLEQVPGLERLNVTKPQWVVDILDQGLPDGAERLSEKTLTARVLVTDLSGDSLETQH